MSAPSEYTEEKAAFVINALSAGRRPGSAARLVNVSRVTLYAWRNERADFAARWDEATAIATDRIEEVVSQLGLNGDFNAASYWLKHRRPERFDRATWLKLRILQTALAQRNGNKRVIIEPGPDGTPMAVEPAPEPEDQVVVILPANGRKTPQARLEPDPADSAATRNGISTGQSSSKSTGDDEPGEDDE